MRKAGEILAGIIALSLLWGVGLFLAARGYAWAYGGGGLLLFVVLILFAKWRRARRRGSDRGNLMS